MELFNLFEVICYYLLVLGISYVITGSQIGYWLRALWCLTLSWSRPSRYWWAIVKCPSCNSWWVGGAVGWFFGGTWVMGLQLAFVSCGLTALIQHSLGGDGMAANEDFEKIFKGDENG